MAPAPAASATPFRILIVDDGPGDVLLIREAITESRFVCTIATATDGVEAMDLLHRAAAADTTDAARGSDAPPLPDLVLLDLNMPRMNGQEVLRSMKADPDLRRIPVVVLTNSDVERDVLAAYDLGAQGFLTKPPDVESLFSAIHGVQDYWFAVVRAPSR